MTAPTLPSYPLRVSSLTANAPTVFDLRIEAAERAVIAGDLELTGLRKLRFVGSIRPEQGRDWLLEGTLGATVVQDCVVTLAAVVTRIDAPVIRRYLANPPEPEESEEGDVEMPQDDSVEALGPIIDPAAVMVEALELNLPLYPRAGDANLGEAVFAAPGVTPMRDEDAKPFAGLADLHASLTGKDKKDD